MKEYKSPDMVKVSIDVKEAFTAGSSGNCVIGASTSFEQGTNCNTGYTAWTDVTEYQCFITPE